MRIESPQRRRERTPFIGRRRELELVRDAFDHGAELVTLVGPSGIGKTRLARQVASELTEAFDEDGGVWFCNLTGYDKPEDLETIVARTLGISQLEGDELLHALTHRGPLLLVLDNADSLAAASAQLLSRWIERCVELRMLMTSLGPSRAKGERIVELQPLELDDAIALYDDRASRAWAGRRLTASEDSEVVCELVRRLDRIPLAIELAAARVRVLPPKTMLSMIEKRFEILRAAPGGLPLAPNSIPRRSSLLGSLEITWSHLEPFEQLVLGRAVVFEHGFTAEAVAAVLAADPAVELEPLPPIEEILDGLQRKALILQDDSEPPRHHLLESVKDYARGELRRGGGWDAAIRSHASFFLDRPEAQKDYGRRPERLEALPWLQAERENFLAIFHRFFDAAPDLAARAGIALSPLLTFEGPSISDTRILEATLDAARRSEDPKLILAAMESLFLARFRHGKHGEAKKLLEDLVELARANDEKEVEAFSLPRLALSFLVLDQPARFQEMLERADRLSPEGSALKSTLHFSRGAVAWLSGDLELAEAELRRSIELDRRQGRRHGDLNTLHNLGLVLSQQGRHLESRQVLEEAIEASRSLNHRTLEAHNLAALMEIELEAGALDEAEAAGLRSLSSFREHGNFYREGELLCQLALVSLMRGDLDQAGERLASAEERLRSEDMGGVRWNLQIFQAALAAKRGELGEAHRLLGTLHPPSDARHPRIEPVLELTRTLIEVIEARRSGPDPASQARISEVRARLARIEVGHPLYYYLRILPRLVEIELIEWEAGTPVADHLPAVPTLFVSEDLGWFRLGEGDPILLRRRRALRGVFGALVRGRVERPGTTVGLETLVRAGWPDEEDPDAVSNRVHHVIWLLRDLGLRKVVRTEPYGFLLDPGVPLEIERGSAS